MLPYDLLRHAYCYFTFFLPLLCCSPAPLAPFPSSNYFYPIKKTQSKVGRKGEVDLGGVGGVVNIIKTHRIKFSKS